MARRIAYLLSIVFLLLTAIPAGAQEKVWNQAIDRYEFICRKCADWRERIERKESVPKDSLKAMMTEIASLKQNLQWTLADMSPGLRRRFEAIRDRYATGEWPVEKGIIPNLDSLSNFTVRALSLLPDDSPQLASAAESIKKSGPKPSAIAGIAAGLFPDFSVGFAAGASLGKWSLFVKAHSNFSFGSHDYDCLSDGTSSGGYFWSGGASTIRRHQVTLDLAYQVQKRFSVYLGAGYGERSLLWKDTQGEWARVSDRSFSGLTLDAGILFVPLRSLTWRHLSLLAGTSYLPSGYLDAEAGLLWQF
ncbi:MAG: hypothetical protein J5771_06105 [Bacteroidales bacterium]|nr:hypothetical protein [Bacteroidales bacterium]